MTLIVDHVHTDQAMIDRLKALQQELDAELHAELHMQDGTVLRGTVVERPSIVQAVDGNGLEGSSAIVRFDTGDAQVHLIALDRISKVVRLGSA